MSASHQELQRGCFSGTSLLLSAELVSARPDDVIYLPLTTFSLLLLTLSVRPLQLFLRMWLLLSFKQMAEVSI